MGGEIEGLAVHPGAVPLSWSYTGAWHILYNGDISFDSTRGLEDGNTSICAPLEDQFPGYFLDSCFP